MKYLDETRKRLVGLKKGMETHPADWAGQPETPATVQADIDEIDAKQSEVDTLEDQLSQKKKSARVLDKQKSLIADTIENKAIGFHTQNPEVLNDYDIKLRKPREKRDVPTKALVPVLKDDVDGKGFRISTQVDPDADKYEWEKGIAANPKDINTIPPMQHFKITSKTSFVDDDVDVGERYFYRVRAFNTTGEGDWSPAKSMVQ